MRAQRHQAGLLKLRIFRPFPGNEIAKALAHVPVIGVMDRAVSFGLVGGPVFNEIRSFAYGGKSSSTAISTVSAAATSAPRRSSRSSASSTPSAKAASRRS